MKTKTVFIAITITLSFIIAGQSFYLYQQYSDLEILRIKYSFLQEDYATLQEDRNVLEQRYASLESEHNSLISQYSALGLEHDSLKQEYTSLQSECSALQSEYLTLASEYNSLSQDFDSLQSEYNYLDQEYEKLFSDYQLLKEVFDKPLTYKQVPTIKDLQKWIRYEDQTNTLEYDDPDFLCGDFAAMLAFHAKVKHWDMGVIGVFGYDRETHEDYAHAFNAIVTTEGLVYVEPQNDDVWWYEDHEEISIGTIYEVEEDQRVYVEDVIVILRY